MSPECLTTPEEPGSASHIAVCEVELFQIKPLPGLRLGEHTKGVLEAGHPCRAEGAVAVVHEHRLVLRHAADRSGGPIFALSNDHSNPTARIRELLRLQLSDERLATANAKVLAEVFGYSEAVRFEGADSRPGRWYAEACAFGDRYSGAKNAFPGRCVG